MTTQCLVSDADYRKYWNAEVSVTHPVMPEVWNGVERRVSVSDRRAGSDRRWDKARGRRYRIADRRKA